MARTALAAMATWMLAMAGLAVLGTGRSSAATLPTQARSPAPPPRQAAVMRSDVIVRWARLSRGVGAFSRHAPAAAAVHALSLAVIAAAPESAPVLVPPVLAQVPPAATVSRTHDGELVASIERAVRGARRRLGRQTCAAVTADFVDASGRSLAEVSAAFGRSPAESLSRVIFRDGRDSATCRTSPAAAFTGPGSRVVFVCPAFLRLRRAAAELVIIHELLHTLGLGELPPTSNQIDRAVAVRCD